MELDCVIANIIAKFTLDDGTLLPFLLLLSGK